MSVLDELKPTKTQRVIDLVSAAGVDVSDWAAGENRAASNPKYCYEWSFVEPGRIVVLNLWHAPMREQNGIVSVNLNLRQNDETGVRRTRAEKFDHALQEATNHLLPIRVVINDGEMRDADDPEAKPSRVKYRLLDHLPWAVTSYDWTTGACTLTRGVLPGRLVDQFSGREELLVEAAYYRESPARLKCIIPRHNKLSNDFRKWLESEHKTKATQEQQCVDIRFRLKGVSMLAELKICFGVGTTRSIREALGQLLEYNHYPAREVADAWLIVLDEQPSEQDRVYIRTLRDKRSLPITIGWQTSEGFSFHPKWPI